MHCLKDLRWSRKVVDDEKCLWQVKSIMTPPENDKSACFTSRVCTPPVPQRGFICGFLSHWTLPQGTVSVYFKQTIMTTFWLQQFISQVSLKLGVIHSFILFAVWKRSRRIVCTTTFIKKKDPKLHLSSMFIEWSWLVFSSLVVSKSTKPLLSC